MKIANEQTDTVFLALLQNRECVLCFSSSIHHHIYREGRLFLFSSLVLPIFYCLTDEKNHLSSFILPENRSMNH